MLIFRFFVVFLLTFCFVSCTSVKRKNEKEVLDFSGNWNNTDSRLVAEEMIKDSLERPWISQFLTTKNRKPVIVVGSVRNNTAEHINVETFIKEIERSFVNSNQIKVVANISERGSLRAELDQIKIYARPETIKKIRKETGADLVLLGVVNDIVDSQNGKRVQFYQINLELIDLENHEKLWIGQKKIAKVVKKRLFTF